jgi:hypothetical protein
MEQIVEEKQIYTIHTISRKSTWNVISNFVLDKRCVIEETARWNGPWFIGKLRMLEDNDVLFFDQVLLKKWSPDESV